MTTRSVCLLAAALLVVAALAATAWAAPKAPRVTRFDTEGPVWSLAPLKGGGFALGEVPAKVVICSAQGRPLREFNVGGLPLALSAGRLSATGPEVVAVAAQDAAGRLYCLANEPAGLRCLWMYSARAPFQSVAVGDVDGDGRAEVVAGSFGGLLCVLDGAGKLKWQATLAGRSSVGALAVADLDGDGRAEIVAGTSDDGVFAYSGVGKPRWHLDTRLPGARLRKQEMLWVRSISVADLTGDGRGEVIVGSRPSGMVTVLSGDGKLLWRTSFPEVCNRWTAAVVEPADVNGDGKPELACLLHGEIMTRGGKGTSPFMLLDSQGAPLAASFPKVSFVCLGSEPSGAGGRQRVILGSATRGRGFFALDYAAGIAPLDFPRPADSLDALVAAVAKMASRPAASPAQARGKAIQVLVPLKFKDIGRQAAPLMGYLRTLEGPGLKYVLMLTSVYEEKGSLRDGYRPPPASTEGRAVYSRDDILAGARLLEQQRIPFCVQAAKVCLPNLRPATCEAILAAAPTACLGFLANEDDPSRQHFDDYVAFAQQVMDACHRHGDRKYLMDEFLDFWSTVPSDPGYFAALFKPAWRDVVVPMYKTNRFVAPEQQAGMILGLWKAGVVGEWGWCTEEDLWKWESIGLYPPHDVLFRSEAAAAAMGATYFRVEENREFIERRGRSWAMEQGTPRHRGLFAALVRRGAIRPAQSPDELLTSPVAFRKADVGLEGPRGKFLEWWQQAYDRRGPWAFPTSLQTLRDDYLPAAGYRLRYAYDGLFPEDPYGLLPLLPLQAGVAIPGAQAWTAGQRGVLGPAGEVVAPAKVRERLLASLEAGAARLPIRVEGCLAVVRKEPGAYVAYLFDTGNLDVAERKASLSLASPERVGAVTDLISGERLTVAAGKVSLRIPAGTLRILEVRLKGAATAATP